MNGGEMVRNESAASFAWLRAAVGRAAVEAWNATRDEMRAMGRLPVLQMADWISDPWLALGAEPSPIGPVVGVWRPPEDLDAWPDFDVDHLLNAAQLKARPTLHAPMVDLLARTPPADPDDAAVAAERFYAGEAAIRQHGDVHMRRVETVRAWLFAAVGSLLDGLMYVPGEDAGLRTEAGRQRLAIPFEFQLPPTWDPGSFGSRRLDLLYNLRIVPPGDVADLDPADIRVGQGEEWREHWRWLSYDQDAAEALDGVQVAAGLMRCEPVVTALLDGLAVAEGSLSLIALGVVRRWLLTLTAMAWVEEALRWDWVDVRPKDLLCFAYNAVKPDWPRRVVAISHRSRDAKVALMGSQLWHAARVAIDANYVPAWETNTAMVWALFASTPAVARVRSASYEESVWCRREIELAQYLLDHVDFHPSRRVLDLELPRLSFLERVVDVWHAAEPEALSPDRRSATSLFREFPPFVEVVAPQPMPPPELAMWRAAAALRLVHALVRDPDTTNAVVAALLDGDQLDDVPPPTNDPGGWADYAAVFREVEEVADRRSRSLAISVPTGYSDDELVRDLELIQRIPDLSAGTPALADVLVAMEWLRTEWPIMAAERRTSFVVLSARGLTRQQWTGRPELSLYRGLLALRLPVPLWIIQSADQRMDEWGVSGEAPIFTEHVEGQFSWMLEVFPDRAEAQARFPEDSGLEFSRAFRKRLRHGL